MTKKSILENYVGPAFRRHFFDSFWASVKRVDLARICHSCWNPVCFFNWFSMLRLTSFCLWNRITRRWEENVYFLFRFPHIFPFRSRKIPQWSASGPAWVRFSKRHKSRRMSSLQKVSRDLQNAKDESWLGFIVGDDSLYEHCGLFGKTWTLLVRHIHDISSKKDQGSNDNNQKSHSFFCWEEMDRRFKGLSFARSGIHNETKRKVIIHGRRGTDCIPINFPTLKLRFSLLKIRPIGRCRPFFSRGGATFCVVKSVSAPSKWQVIWASRIQMPWQLMNPLPGWRPLWRFSVGKPSGNVGSWTWPSRWNEAQTKKGPI